MTLPVPGVFLVKPLARREQARNEGRTCVETNDVGAINFGGGGDANFTGRYSSPWNLNETVRWNNITRTVGAEARDGVHVCRGAKGGWGGEPRRIFAPDAPSDCAWATWSIYLDGGYIIDNT